MIDLPARLSPLLLSLLPLVGCVGPTAYQAAIDGEGYREREVETNRFRISFSGNSFTTRDTVETYLLYRAAELTLASGHDFFVVVEKETERSTVYLTTSFAGFHGYHPFPGFCCGLHSAFLGGPAYGTTRPVHQYEASAMILVFSGNKLSGDPNAYDARDVVKHLDPLIVRPRKTAS